MTGDLEALRTLLIDRSLRRGDFVLASGARSTWYIDARRTTMSGAGQALIGRAGLALIEAQGWDPSAVGGLTLGADPVAYAVARAAADTGRRIDAFTVRKESKAHGLGRRIEGCFEPGAAVVVIEDVITTGESALRAIAALTEERARILGVLAVVDRQEGGRGRIEAAGHALVSLVTASDLLREP